MNHMSSYTFVSFNCKSVKRSIDSIRELCRSSDIIALQETWLRQDELTFLSTIDSEFEYTGTSAMDMTAGMLRGRPYGGVALLWRSAVFQQVSLIPCDNPRLCAVNITTSDGPIVVVCVYMPCDSKDNLPEFTDCLSEVSALIDECNVQPVYILGDFNAHPNELFYNELMYFCSIAEWCCVDTQANVLGSYADTYTYMCPVTGSRRWLDHCVTSQSAIRSILNVYVKNEVSWSDHYPLIIKCRLNLLPPRTYTKSSAANSKVIWGERSMEQIALYSRECHERLRLIDFPMEFKHCSDKNCNDVRHRKMIDILYSNIVSALSEAASVNRDVKRKSNKKRIIGWNTHVRDVYMVAREKYEAWTAAGRPRHGYLYDEMVKAGKCSSPVLSGAKITNNNYRWI